MAKKILYVPFEDGEMVDYAFGETHTDPKPRYEWKPNFTFKARMRVKDWSRGRSAVQIQVQDAVVPPDADARTFYMFMKDFFEVVQRVDISNGVTALMEWTFVKRGANFGIKAVLPALPDDEDDG